MKGSWHGIFYEAIRFCQVSREEQMIYGIVVEKGEDFGYVAHCPTIPGCHSQGNTIEEATESIKDAIRGCRWPAAGG